MKFIDLFSGLGGFHLALKRIGHTCVFASEINETLKNIYFKNFGLIPVGDIRQVNVNDIPDHEILCAGFPCQPFSKAGEQKGLQCERNGDLIEYVLEVIDKKKPDFIFLENVPNLVKHNDGETYKYIKDRLNQHFTIDDRILSPHKFGDPQIRRRLFIVGSRNGLSHFHWPKELPDYQPSIYRILDQNPSLSKKISPNIEKCLETWQEFITLYPKDQYLPSFPVWSMEFGATYPFEEETPFTMTLDELRNYNGNHGVDLASLAEDRILDYLPSYAKRKNKKFPKWKIRFIKQNRSLYEENKEWIDTWKQKILPFSPSLQKLEWNCKGENRNIWEYIIHVRASGVRVKRATTSPSLVAMTTSQVPIIGWEKRYLTVKECSRLQGMDELPHLPDNTEKAMTALGNAVNVNLVERIANSLIPEEKKDIQSIVSQMKQLALSLFDH